MASTSRFFSFGFRLGFFFFLIFFPAFFLQGLARGAQPPERLVLGLPEIIQMAINKNPAIAEIESDIAASKSDLDQVNSAYYPQLEATGLFGPVQDAKEPLVVNGRITDPSPGLSTSSIGVFGRLDLTMTQPLYTFGKLSNRKGAATQGLKAKEYQIAKKKGEIVLQVKELYYALILARAGVSLADESQGFFAESAKRIQRLLDLHSPNVRESDLYRVDAYRADSTRIKAEAEKGLKIAYFALKSYIRLPAGTEFDPAEKALSMNRQALGDLDRYLQTAAAERPEFKQLAAGLAAQEFQVKAATSDRYPSFFAALKGSVAGAPGRESLYNPYIPDEFNRAYAGVVAGVRWNFDFGISRARVEKMRAEYDKLRNTKAFAEMSIPIQVVKNYQEHLEWREAAASYQKAAVASRKWVFSAMSDYDMGVGSAYDLLNAIEKYGQNQGKYLEALLRYNVTMDELEYAVGLKTW